MPQDPSIWKVVKVSKRGAASCASLASARSSSDPTGQVRRSGCQPWRFDFAWPEQRVAVEVEGGTFSGGRHTRPLGFRKDCEKLNEATCRGWRVLRVTTEMVKSGEALTYLQRLLA